MIKNVLTLITILILFIYINYVFYYKYKLQKINKINESIYIKNKNKNNSTTPKVLMQTHYDKKLIPQKVYDNIKKFAPNYKHIIYDNNECLQFLREHYNDEIVNRFNSLKKGAHKADLFRYCWLYTHGGVYLDIKIILLKDIEDIFIDTSKLYSVISQYNKHYDYKSILLGERSIFQGIISTPPNNPIFKSLINKILITNDVLLRYNYTLFTKHFYQEIKSTLQQETEFEKGYLFHEHCYSPKWNPLLKTITKKLEDIKETDKYDIKCAIYNKDERIFLTRYPEYPW